MSISVNIEKSFRGFTLKVQFEATDLSTGILGASGSGKSMTLRCIAGIETPDRGKIVIHGKTVFDSEEKINLKPQERQVGYLFQNYALFPTMTVRDNIRCGFRGEKKNFETKKYRILSAAIIWRGWKIGIPLSYPEGSSRELPWPE